MTVARSKDKVHTLDLDNSGIFVAAQKKHITGPPRKRISARKFRGIFSDREPASSLSANDASSKRPTNGFIIRRRELRAQQPTLRKALVVFCRS
jgi:hypothetical protein